MVDSLGSPVVVGTVALDFLHAGALGAGIAPATVRWGGVANNVACALGVRQQAPRFVTADYEGELRSAVSAHLRGNGVRWTPLPVRLPLPVFHAELVDGSVAAKHFIGEAALDSLNPALLDRHRKLFADASVIAAATDSPVSTLRWLAETAAAARIPFWLLSADPTEVDKLRALSGCVDLIAINLRELGLYAGADLTDRDEIVAAARDLAGPGATCVATLGDRGAVLVTGTDAAPVFQPARSIATGVTVGAGDVLFAGLLEGRLAGRDWSRALNDATGLTARYLTELQRSDLPYEGLRDPAPMPR